MEHTYFFAVDLGATSGRTILGCLGEGKMELKELTRFPNHIIETGGHCYWDIYALYNEIIRGLKVVAKDNLPIRSIGIDTWGVDFVFVGKDGELLRNPYCYRDPHTTGAPEEYFTHIPRERVYDITGIQIMNFNSLFQLSTLHRNHCSALEAADKILFMPDALSYMLTGKMVTEYTIASTSQMLNPRTKRFEKELLDGTFLVPDAMTVEEMLYKWIPIQSSKHKWSPKTYTQSVAMVQNLIVPYIGKRKVQDLRTYDIEQFYATLSQTPCGQYVHGEKQELTENQKKRLLSSTSIHEVHTLLKTAFSYAVDWDLIHKSPTPREAPKINTEERTIWDERTMLAALQTIENPALHLAVHMSMILSLREGEILGLQPGDLDFDAADGRGTISVNKALQRADKVALSKIDPTQIYHTFPDRREGSKSSLILKRTKTKKSNRILYMTKPLKEELLAWLEKMKQDEQNAPEKYSNCGQLFRLPDGLPIAPDVLTKWYRMWRAEHLEFEKIVFHGLRHSSATYQLLQSGGDFKSVQGNTGHATATVLMDTYAHTQDKPRLELTEKIEADFYSQDVAGAKPQEPPENKTPVATKITGKMILEAIRQMDAEERRELTRVLFA